MRSQQIDCFLEVVSTHSFARASENLFISVSMVSYYINSLEKEIGIALINRNKHSVVITPAGEAFYQDMVHAKIWLEESIKKTRKIAQLRCNTLQIGWMTNSPISLPGFLSEWKRNYPNDRIVIHPFPYSISDLQNKIIDIAIIDRTDIESSPDIGFLPLRQCQGVIFVSRLNPLSKKESFIVEDLVQEVIALPESIMHIKSLSKIHHDIREVCPSINIQYFSDFISSGIPLVKANACVLVAMDFTSISDPDIVMIPIRPSHYMEIGVAWRIMDYDQRVQNFLETIQTVSNFSDLVKSHS